jgi:quinol monooxygenase YgiN
MSISFLTALGGVQAAAVGVVVLVVRLIRRPRLDLLAWVIATAGLTIALAAQVVGFRSGFTQTTFRAVQLGAQMIAPLALAWGITEVAARSMPVRFVARLGLSALTVVALVILGTDPLSSQPFTRTWPAASVHFQVIPNALLKLLAVVAVLIAVAGAIAAGVRIRGDRGWRNAFVAVGMAGVAVLVTEGLGVHLPANTGYPVLCVLAAALAVVASVLASRFQSAALRGSGDDTGWGPAAAGAGQYGGDDSLGLYSGSGQGGYPAPAEGYADGGGYQRYGGAGYGGPDADYDGPVTGAFERPLAGAFDGPGAGGFDGSDSGSFDGPVTGMFDPLYQENGFGGQGAAAQGPGESAGVWHRDIYPDEDTGPDVALQAAMDAGAAGLANAPDILANAQDIKRLYGQIAIYTLLEHGAEEFDRLAEQVVEQVRANEPDTLLYVLHGVPSAPLQRILYEVYRDRVAYDNHACQSYIREFELGRLPLVLATNVIELGVRQAKVSSLGPSAGSPPGRQVLSGTPLPPESSGRRSSGSVSSGPPPPGPRTSGPRSSGPPPGSRPSGPRSSGPRPAGPTSSGPRSDGLPYGTAPGGRGRGGRPPGEQAP